MEEDCPNYKSIHTIMLENSLRSGSKDYIVSVDQGKSISFDQIKDYTGKIANFLKSKQIKKEERICLIGKNSIETITIFLGVMRYGAIVSPINFEESGENIFHAIQRVKPRVLIYDQEIGNRNFGDEFPSIPFADMEFPQNGKLDFFSLTDEHDKVF